MIISCVVLVGTIHGLSLSISSSDHQDATAESRIS